MKTITLNQYMKYKTEDVEFERQLRLSLYDFKACTPDYIEIEIQKIKKHVNDFLLSRCEALREATIKDLENMKIIEQDNSDGFVPPLAMSMYATGFRDAKSQIIEHLKLNK